MTNDYADHLVAEVRCGRMSRRELIRRGSVYGLSFSAIGALLAACGGNPSKGADTSQRTVGPGKEKPFRKGGTARLGVVTPPGAMDPITDNDDGTTYTVMVACEYLCFPRPDLSLEPKLATAWKPGSSVKEWTFTLRSNVLWHDGSKLTADDVVASFDRYSDPKGVASALSSFDGILSKGNIERVDDLTVRFHLDRPYADFPYLVCALNYATPVLPKNYTPGDYRKGGVGTGAYVLRSYKAQRSAHFVRNDRYWGGSPHLDAVEITYYSEPAPMVLAMQGGREDLLPLISYKDSQNLRGRRGVQVFESPSSSYRPAHMRVDTAPFDDKRVRQAIALSVDRQALVTALLGGSAQIGNDHAFAPVFPTSPAAGAVAQRKLDVGQAKKLLAAAGHGNGLSITLTTLQYQDIPQLAVLLKQQLAKANVDLSLKVLTSTAYFGSGNNQPWLEVPMGIIYWASRGTPSQLIEPAYLSRGVWNSAHWKSSQFDQLMASFDGESDEAKRKQTATKAAQLMHDETPALIPYWLKEIRAVNNGLQGVPPGPAVVLDPSGMGFAA